MLKSRSSKVAAFGVLIFSVAGLVLVHDYLWIWEESGIATSSKTVAESKARGICITPLKAVPSDLSIQGRAVRISSAWLEYCSSQSERWLAPAEQRLNGVSLCFTTSGDLDPEDFFVVGDDGAGVTECSWSHDTTVHVIDLDQTSAVESLRLSLTDTFDSPRPKNIRFVVQP